jgi:hypothetical protein|tara:strand:- start:749 stop:1657 length:909 start_codon:yes stop_codon:yes gene_type:complete
MATQVTQTLPPKFVEDLGKDLATQVTAQTGVPIVTSGAGTLTQQTGETAEQFAARQKAAQQFDIRKQSLAGIAPGVAGQDALQQQAQALAQSGIGSYQPFLQAAQAATGPQAFQQYMSPYQSQVIDTTLKEFDRNKQIQEQQIRDNAVASGAFGGGREGVQLAEFGSGMARERAGLQAQLQQQGFEAAKKAAQQQFANQQGLAQLLPSLQSADVSTLGKFGAINQAQKQAEMDAEREAAKMAAYQPQEQVDRYANIVTGIMGGYPGGSQSTNVPNASPLQSALGIGSTLAGIYGSLGGKLFG